MVATTSVDISKPVVMLRKVNKWIRLEIPNLTKKEALRGARFAKQIAPKDTWSLWQAIDMAPGRKGGDDTSYLVVSRQPNNPGSGRTRPYHIWINEGKRGWAKGLPKHGEHRYMEATAQYLKKQYFPLVKRELQKAIKR